MTDDKLKQRVVDAFNKIQRFEERKISSKYIRVKRVSFPVPLNHYGLYSIYQFEFAHPVPPIYIGIASDRPPIQLRRWFDFEYLLQADGTLISTPEQARDYATLAFLIDQSPHLGFSLVSKASDIPIRNKEEREHFVSYFEPFIRPPGVTALAQGFLVTFYVNIDNVFKHYMVLILPTGQMQKLETTLIKTPDSTPIFLKNVYGDE